MNAVMGYTSLDRFSEILGTGYQRFQSPTGISGLAKQEGTRLDVLALHASTPGTGQFRAFIEGCKASYDTVCIWELWNRWLPRVLERYGFRCVEETHYGEEVTGYRWDLV